MPDTHRTIRFGARSSRLATWDRRPCTAADLIKLAMINIWRKLNEEGLRAKMIMQVHDELVFEVPKSELDQVKELVKGEMEQAIDLNVPIHVDMGVGGNWFEAH